MLELTVTDLFVLSYGVTKKGFTYMCSSLKTHWMLQHSGKQAELTEVLVLPLHNFSFRKYSLNHKYILYQYNGKCSESK